MHRRKAFLGVALAFFALAASWAFASAVTLPSGERLNGQSVVEPAYNDADGTIMYLLTPSKAKAAQHVNGHAVSPLYIIMYPNSASASVGVMNCAHQPVDNCFDHGPVLSGLAASVFPGVYGPPDGSGVWGHDHIGDGPGGSEFNIAWEPVVVLFTNSAAANTHITTEAQLDAAEAAGDAIEIPLPEATFLCSVVSVQVYNHATPAPTVP